MQLSNLTPFQSKTVQISFMLDYKSTEHFFSSFKKRTGFTPLEYRSYGRETGGEEG